MCANVDQMCDKMCPIVWRQKDKCYQLRKKPNSNDKWETLEQSFRGTAWDIGGMHVVCSWSVQQMGCFKCQLMSEIIDMSHPNAHPYPKIWTSSMNKLPTFFHTKNHLVQLLALVFFLEFPNIYNIPCKNYFRHRLTDIFFHNQTLIHYKEA